MSQSATTELLEQAVTHRHRGELEDARACCNRVLAEDAHHARAKFVLATVEGQAGNLSASERLIREAIADGPDEAVFQVYLAKTLSMSGRLDDAHAAYGEALRHEPDLAIAHNGLGEVYGKSGRLAEARTEFEAAAELDPGMAVAHRNLGTCLLKMGEVDDAIRSFQRSIELDPVDPYGQHSLAALYNMTGDIDSAIASLQELLKAQPDDPKALNNLAAALMNKGEMRRAYGYLQDAIKLAPNYAAPYNNLGKILHGQCRFDQAQESFEKAIKLKPDFPDVYANIGFVFQALNRLDDAEGSYKRCLELAPEHPIALSGLAALCENRGEYEVGLTYLQNVMDGAELDASCVLTYASLMRGIDQARDAIDTLKRRLDKKPLSHDGKVQIHFALGDLYDDLKDYDQAFENYRIGNEGKHAVFDVSDFESTAGNIIDAFSPDKLKRMPRSDRKTERPVFILGMPRSGKSLLEQIVASHPVVYGAGELGTLGRIAMNAGPAAGIEMPYPACLPHIDSNALDKMADYYLRELGHDDSRYRYVTDTMPMNFMHIGLIELMLPSARIIHCIRNTDDVLISCYAKNFLDPTLAFTYDLKTLAAYIEQYERFMNHWRRVSSLKMLEIDYANVVHDPEGETRKILEFLDLDWTEDCMRFYEDAVPTLSGRRWIREPLHDHELGCYSRYRQYVEPLAD